MADKSTRDRVRFKDEMILTASPELAALVKTAPSTLPKEGFAAAMPILADYLKTQETDEHEIRLRVADVRVLTAADQVGQIPLQHDCDECRRNRSDAEMWLDGNPGGVMMLVLFEYDEVAR